MSPVNKSLTTILPTASRESETEVKKSRFLATLIPMTNESDLKELQQSLKTQHPKASHVCYGFRLIDDKGFISEGFSDDGEPSGTSGPPILKVLQHKKLANCGILITRYFGGTKLGTGGLQRAYGQAASDVIASLEDQHITQWQACNSLRISCSFADEAALRRLLLALDTELIGESYGTEGPELSVRLTVESVKNLRSDPLARLLSITPDEA
ncbi:MAG: YigZ family protein [Thalassolituus sp.]